VLVYLDNLVRLLSLDYETKLSICGVSDRLEDNEKLVLTPFEKNLDIWRQLWRVLERCDLVCVLHVQHVLRFGLFLELEVHFMDSHFCDG